MSDKKCPCGKCHCFICGNQMERDTEIEKLTTELAELRKWKEEVLHHFPSLDKKKDSASKEIADLKEKLGKMEELAYDAWSELKEIAINNFNTSNEFIAKQKLAEIDAIMKE